MNRPLAYLLTLVLSTLLSCSQSNPDRDPNHSLRSATWPIFRGDSALSGVASDPLPDSLALLWSFETGAEIVSTPAVGRGRVYVSSTDGKVYALDAVDGSLVWDFIARNALEASPALQDTVLYVGALDGSFYALNAATGKLLWETELSSGIYGSANFAELPTGSAKLILVGCYDNRLYCLDANSGEQRWTYETENYINGTPATDGRRVVFGGCDGNLHIVNVADGSGTGQVSVGSYVPGSAAVADGHAYVGHYNQAVVRVDLAGQTIVWEYRAEGQGGAFFSSPAIGSDRVVVGSRDEFLHCLNRETGEKLWTFRTRGNVDSSPVIAGDAVIFGSDDGRLYRVDLASGRETWTYEIGGTLTGSPAVAGGCVFIGSEDGRIYAFGEAR